MTETMLKIKRVTQHPTDPTCFVVQFNRNLTQYEQSTVVGVISDEFLPAKVTAPDAITVRQARAEFFTEPLLQERLKKLVGDAEALAVHQLMVQRAAEGQATAAAEETRRELAAIDWEDDSIK